MASGLRRGQGEDRAGAGGSAATGAGTVKRRAVFYLEGYDPRGPSHYHGLYRDEAAKQEPLNGLALTIGPRRKADSITATWTVSSSQTETFYHFLRYDDVMRERWSKTNIALVRDIFNYAWPFTRDGVFLGTYRHAYPFLIFITMAPLLVIMVALLSGLVGLTVGLLLHWAAGLAASSATLFCLLSVRERFEPNLASLWIGRYCSFTSDQGRGRVPVIDQRIKEFAARITHTINAGGMDEVLLIGHSAGAQIAVSVAAEVLRSVGPEKHFSFLTLGNVIGTLALQPTASAFRDDLVAVAKDQRAQWIDITAPSDVLCYPLTDPLAVCGIAMPAQAEPSPKILNAHFPRLFPPNTYKRLKRDFYRMHFQYLMAGEISGDYDFFLITAGSLTLKERYASHASVSNFNRFKRHRG